MDEWMLDNLLRSVQQLDISDNQTVPTNGSTSVEAAAAANIQQSVNMQTLSGPNESGQPGVIGGENRSANSQLPSHLQTKCTPYATKEWHLSIPINRYHTFHKLGSAIYQAIVPYPELSFSEALVQEGWNKRMSYLAKYATRVEAEMYHTADSQKEYYLLITEKIYEIRKKIDEKLQRIKELQQLQAQQQQQQQQLPAMTIQQHNRMQFPQQQQTQQQQQAQQQQQQQQQVQAQQQGILVDLSSPIRKKKRR